MMDTKQLEEFCIDYPEQAAAWIAELRAALQAYVNEAKSHSSQGKPDSPFRLRLVAAERALNFRETKHASR